MGGSRILDPQCELQRGKRFLSGQKPHLARRALARRIGLCPSRRERAKLFSFLGIAARREGLPNLAIGYFVEAYSHRKLPRLRRKIRAITNDFGMAKLHDTVENDWQAFYCIHLRRYIESKKSKRLGTRAESDMIRELIHEHWCKLRESPLVSGLDPDRKLLLYNKVVIIFPYFDVPRQVADTTVHVDFTKKGRLGPADRCFCGSGLTFKLCCGRTRGEDELMIGEF